jgi:molybdopterin-guanine dinucleotide biosynthesis protein A
MATVPRLAGAVLCGGASSRMGRDKASIVVGGQTLLDRMLALLGSVAHPLILASNDREHERPGCVRVEDALPRSGPLGGVVAALSASPHELCAVVAVDMPACDPALLQTLARACDGHDAALPRSDRGVEPLHAVYARRALPALREALGGRDLAMHSVVQRLDVRTVDTGAATAFAFNLNRPGDLTAWMARRRAAGAPPR